MYLLVSNAKVELKEPENFRAFKVVAEGSNVALAAVQAALSGIATVPDSTTAWVSAGALFNWHGLADRPEWKDGLTAMIEKARPYGWIDPDTGAIKAHIEWTK